MVEGFNPNWVSHPMETVKDYLKERGYAEHDLFSPEEIEEISGTTQYSPVICERLSAEIGASPAFWWKRSEHYLEECLKQGRTPEKQTCM